MNNKKRFLVLFSILEFSNSKIEKAFEIVNKKEIVNIENLIDDIDFIKLLSTEEYHKFVHHGFRNQLLLFLVHLG